MILPDVHLDEETPEEYLPVKKLIKDLKPDEIVLLGDFMDVSSLSAWDLDKKRRMEGQRYIFEVVTANKELDFLQKHSKKITYLEGNHEDRVNRYLDKYPEMEGLIEPKKVLKLKKRKIKWYKYNELYQIGKFYLTHGMYITIHHAKKHLLSLGCNIIYGHTHGAQTHLQNMKMQLPHMAYGLGCLCNKEPDYMRGRPANWINQFAIMEVNKEGLCWVYPVNIVDGKFIWNGKEYGK